MHALLIIGLKKNNNPTQMIGHEWWPHAGVTTAWLAYQKKNTYLILVSKKNIFT